MPKAAKRATPNEVFSHWYQMIEGLTASSQGFYEAIEAAVNEREMPNTKLSRITYKEGGVISAKRMYLRVARKGIQFDICAAPFGKGFFISWWLGEKPDNIIKKIGRLLGIGLMTYYKVDTMLMFQTSVHSAVMEVLDGLSEAQGVRPLSELQRKPELKI